MRPKKNHKNAKIIGYQRDGIIQDMHCVGEGGVPIYDGSLLSLEITRHSGAHLLAYVIAETYPGTEFGIGPVRDQGFFYDVRLPEGQLSANSFEKIKLRMVELIRQGMDFERIILSHKEAQDLFKKDRLKSLIVADLIKDNKEITAYKLGDFVDLCRGPHVQNANQLSEHFIIESISEVLWRENKVQRIVAKYFHSAEDLIKYQEYKKNALLLDHRKQLVDRQLAFFLPQAPGQLFWTGYGLELINKLKKFVYDETAGDDFEHIETPQLYRRELWEATGHLKTYRENMFPTENDLFLKPMNCPAHCLCFIRNINSYRQLPYRYFEYGTCSRNEPAGSLIGAKRAIRFRQDDGHIFCTIDQIAQEVVDFMRRAKKLYAKFGFKKMLIKIATRPEKYIGDIESWNLAEKMLQDVMEKNNYEFVIAPGEGAFYGPKIELHIQGIFKLWQCGTMQVDFNLAKNMGATFVDQNNQKQYPVVLHRATLGSLERFLAIFLENDPVFFPEINPYPIVIIPIRGANIDYLTSYLDQNKIKYKIDDSSLKPGAKKHKWRLISREILFVGPRESQDNKVTILKQEKNHTIDLDQLQDLVG
jgi:threonyl-tRNA synthetase